MLDREKVIDEIKNYMRENSEMGWVNEDEVLQKIKELLPDGVVVLTKEELMDIQARVAYLQEELGELLKGDNISVSAREYGQLLYANDNTRKETVKEILRKAEKKARFVDGGYYGKDRYELDLDDLKTIIKDFGV